MSNLSSQLARLQENLAASSTPISLYTYLLIYHKAQKECYISYNHGSKALLSFLVQGSFLQIPIKRYPQILDKSDILPQMFRSFEIIELTKIILERGKMRELYSFAEIEKAIYYVMMREIL